MSVPELRVQRPVFQQDDLDRQFGYGKHRRRKGALVAASERCSADALLRVLLARVPALAWLAAYDWRRDLPGDLVAGATVAVMHVPQGMAYAMLGGVPPITGIHMAFYPVLPYALLGTSRHISVGTFTVVCIMTGNAVLEHADSYSPLEVASAVSFMAGCYLVLMSVLRMGALASLLSDPLVSGFSASAACHAFASQLKDALGVRLPRRRGAFNVPLGLYDLALAVPDTNLAALAVSAATVLVIALNNEVLKPWCSRRCSLPVPIELIVVVTASLVGSLTIVFEDYALQTVGDIPTGLLPPRLPPLGLLPLVAVDALTVAVVAYTIATSLSLLFAARERYVVDANQEMTALGVASLVGSLFGCMPVSASPSRSALQLGVGGRTQLTSVVSCLFLLVVLLWLGPFFEPMPRCVLAGIILIGLKPMIMQVGDLVRFWRLSRLDGALWLLTFSSVVLVDLDVGLGVGVVGSVAILFVQSATPYTCQLLPLAGTDIYVDARRYARTEPLKGIKILQFCGALNFATQGKLKTAVRKLASPASRAEDGVPAVSAHTVIVDLGAVTRIDPSGVSALRALRQDLAAESVTLLLAAANTPVLDAMRRCSGILDAVVCLVFPTTHDAVVYAQSTEPLRL